MKSYAIYDKDLDRASPIGYLFYYEKAKGFIIELQKDLDEWEAPLLFQKSVREKKYTISNEISLMWVRERVIPSGRQNIGSILKNHNLKEYSEIAMLELSKGKSSQDACYIKAIDKDQIPQEIIERRNKNICECFPTEDKQIICMYKDDVVQKVDISLLSDRYNDITYVLKNKEILNSVKIGIGGYSIVFNDSIEVQTYDLRKIGKELPLSYTDLINFVRRNLINTTKACDMMQCSRQNLSYMVKTDKLQPIIIDTKENFYMKGDIEGAMSN